MDDSRYIEYLLDQRIMRRSKNPASIRQVYSSKYMNWITEYLNDNHIDDVPMFIICNTLYKLPDTFKIRKNSFFVGDFYLFSYFYDWNWVLGNEDYQENIVNLCIKQYIESCYLNGEIDMAYWLCLTSDGLEDYKKDSVYRDEAQMVHFTDRTDIQEEFAMIHEAGHYLFRFLDRESALAPIKEIHDKIQMTLREQPEYEKISGKELEHLYEECFCDTQAVLYVVEHLDQGQGIGEEECYMLLFKALLYTYALRYIDIVCQKSIETTGDYFDYQLWELMYRIGNVYNALFARLAGREAEHEIENLSAVYEEFLDILQIRMEEVRRVTLYVKETVIEYENEFREAVQTDCEEKERFIREYLNVL
jgi:hypothetical protein